VLDIVDRFLFAAIGGAINRAGWTLPRIRKRGDLIIARSPVMLGLATIGGCARSVTLDLNRKFVRIKDRRLWFVRWSRVLTFPQIAAVEYGYVDLNRVSSYIPFNSHQEFDIYEIGLRLTNNESVLLFQFRGSGAWDNTGPLPDWMYLGDQLEAQLEAGDQEQSSRIFAEVLSSRIGVPMSGIP